MKFDTGKSDRFMMKQLVPIALYLMAINIAAFGTSAFVMFFQATIVGALAKSIGIDYLLKKGGIGKIWLTIGFVAPFGLSLMSAIYRTFC